MNGGQPSQPLARPFSFEGEGGAPLSLRPFLKKEPSQLFINGSPWAGIDDIKRSLGIVDLIDDSIGADSVRAITRQLKLQGMTGEGRLKKSAESVSNVPLDVRVQPPNAAGRFRGIPGPVRLHCSRPKTVPCSTHRPA